MLKIIPEEDYERVVSENPLLLRHPEWIKDRSQNSRDFAFPGTDTAESGVPSREISGYVENINIDRSGVHEQIHVE